MRVLLLWVVRERIRENAIVIHWRYRIKIRITRPSELPSRNSTTVGGVSDVEQES